MAHDVFVSYSHLDKPVADAVCATLESRGVRCWIAPRDVLPGDDYASALVNAIHASRLLVLVFSSGANQSPQVLREVERAVSKGLPILPLRIEDVTPSASMEYYISSRHWLDALTTPLEQHLVQLADTVTLLLARTAVAPAPHVAEPPVRPVPDTTLKPAETMSPPPAFVTPREPVTKAPPTATVPAPSVPQVRDSIARAGILLTSLLGFGAGWERFGAQMFHWTSSQVGNLSLFRLVTLGLGFVIGGIALRTHPPRKVAAAGGLLFGAGVLLTGLLPGGSSVGLPWFLVTYGILSGAGAGMGYITVIATLLRWFPDRRGMIAGLATAAFGAGSVGANWLLQMFGFRALIPFGIACLAVTMFCARVLENPVAGFAPAGWTPSARERLGRAARPGVLRDALHSWQWFALWGLLFVNTLAGIVAVVTLMNAGVASAATLVGVLWTLGIVGSLLWAWLSDRAGARQVLVGILALQALLLLFFPASVESGALLMMVVAALNGGAFGLAPVLAADTFGVEDLGAVYGVMLSGWCLALLMGPSAPALIGAFSSHRAGFIVAGMMFLAAAVIAWFLRPAGGTSHAT